MREYSLYRRIGCPIRIHGRNIIDAVEGNMDVIARVAELGNAAGYRLESVETSYDRGSALVVIHHTGMPLAHTGDVGPLRITTVRIGGVAPSELPTPHQHTIAANA